MTGSTTAFRPSPAGMSPATRLKLAATALIAVPAVLLLLLGIGEMAGGEISGIQHIPEAALLLLLAAAAWRYPGITGVLLVVMGAVFFAVWLVLIGLEADINWHSLELLGWIGTGALLFAVPVIAGALLMKAAQIERSA